MVESSPDMILIVKDEVIQYCNPTGIEHYGLNAGENYSNLFEPEFLTTLSSYIEKAAYGAKFELSEITVIGKDSKKILTDMWVGEIIWDGVPAVELIIRTKNH